MTERNIIGSRSESDRRFLRQAIDRLPAVVKHSDREIRECLEADRFAAHLLMTTPPIEGAPTGAEILRDTIEGLQTDGLAKGLAIGHAIGVASDALGVPRHVVQMYYHTRNDIVLSPEGLTPREWFEGK